VARSTIQPTGVERSFDPDKIIVSKTDTKGILTYANGLFCEVAGYTESEVIGKPHNMIRHPDMPRCIFKFLWDNIQSGKEIFAYVFNLCKTGEHYWVLAHVTPTFDAGHNIIGFHSSRRVPEEGALALMRDLYPKLRAEELRHSSPKDGLNASMGMLQNLLAEKGVGYDEFIHSL
jgi:PAS domain S-box-containing protein